MRSKNKHRSFKQYLQANWRDTLLLIREFQQPLFWFILVILGAGLIYYYLALGAGEPVSSIPEAVYLTLTLAFLQNSGTFPNSWYLQIFFFLLPLIVLSILAQGLANFTILLFNRRARGKEWEMAVASTFDDHVILVGLGHLGYRVVKKLIELDQKVVVVELDPEADLFSVIQTMGVPVITGDATRTEIMSAAGVLKAHSIILCTQNDSINLQIALKARSMNSKIEVVIRIFEDDFAEQLRQQFGFKALSATTMAAPIFAATAADIDISSPIAIGGQPNSLARIIVKERSGLIDTPINKLEDIYTISIVLLTREKASKQHPEGTISLLPEDEIVILGHPEKINLVIHDNQ
jgi:Trk K+ transport system NAD-binding subunit